MAYEIYPDMDSRTCFDILSRLERDLFPWIGKRPIAQIKAPELLAVLRRVESRGALESAHRIRTIAGQVFRYAVATGRAERDPSADLKGALPQPGEKHHAAITNPKEVAPLLKAIDGYQDQGHFVVKCALSPHVLRSSWGTETRRMGRNRS